MAAEKKSTDEKNELVVTSKSGQTKVTVKVGNPSSGHTSGLQEQINKQLNDLEKKLTGN